VIAAAGAGATSSGQRDAIAYAYEQNVVVVVTTRTGSGRIAPRGPTLDEFNANDDHPQRIAGEDLAPIKARILLMLALTATVDLDDIRRMFAEY
jgi:L-asparaginase/Glu-tRNA(Gln) amidotransferase subunit D